MMQSCAAFASWPSDAFNGGVVGPSVVRVTGGEIEPGHGDVLEDHSRLGGITPVYV